MLLGKRLMLIVRV